MPAVRSRPTSSGSTVLRRLALLLLLPTATAADDGHPLTLWVAEGATNQVYLLGSVHLLRRQDHPLPERIDDVYEDAETLYMELDMDAIDPVAMQAAVNRLGVLADGTTLEDLMGPERYADALAAATAIDIPLELLNQSEPWLAAITIEQMILARIGFNPQYGVELYFTAKATEDDKPLFGFETIDEQLAFLDGLSMEAQLDLLMQTLEEAQDVDTLMNEMIRAWRLGDTNYLESEMLAELRAYPELHARIVTERNERWVDQIEALLDDDDDYLVIVGALHLVGEEGVPQLLEARGVAVRQMREIQTAD